MDETFKQLFDKSEITLDLSSEDSINKAMIEYAYFFWNAAWLESARRADKRAREECIRIAADIAINKRGTAGDVLSALTRKQEEL